MPASSGESDGDFNWPPTDEELVQYGGKTSASQPPAPAFAQAVTPPSFSEPPGAEFDWTLQDEGLTRAGAEDPTTLRVAVAQNETALDGTSPGEWVAEIARLQELIEGLTQKLEWRVKPVGRERRLKQSLLGQSRQPALNDFVRPHVRLAVSRRFDMLNAFKNRGAGSQREVSVDEQRELVRLIKIARAERAAMDETLLSLRERSAQSDADRRVTRSHTQKC